MLRHYKTLLFTVLHTLCVYRIYRKIKKIYNLFDLPMHSIHLQNLARFDSSYLLKQVKTNYCLVPFTIPSSRKLKFFGTNVAFFSLDISIFRCYSENMIRRNNKITYALLNLCGESTIITTKMTHTHKIRNQAHLYDNSHEFDRSTQQQQ